MKKYSLLLLLLLNFSFLFAQKVENALLWEISGNGLKKSSYIYGTIHLICPNDLNITALMREKLSASDKLCLEIKMDDEKEALNLMPLLLMPQGQQWETVFGKKKYEKVKQYFTDSIKMPIQMVQMMQPFFAFSIIMPKFYDCTPQSYEQVLSDLAKAQNKEILAVETMKDQMKALANIPIKKQADMLYSMIHKSNKTRKGFQELIEVYKAEDLEKMLKMSDKDDFSSDKKSADGLLKNRNQAWIPVMERMTSENAVFFAVGAAHLAGDFGIVTLLRQKGFTVKPLK